jgi:L-alanine-DL-glutamate epimerase-like enolase superfamily enzyme
VTVALSDAPRITSGEVAAFRIPTKTPEADGTLDWSATTLVTVVLNAADQQGFGYTYADRSTAVLIEQQLLPLLIDGDATATAQHWQAMVRSVRNLGRDGIAGMAISAVDIALWDLRARLFGQPLAALLGRAKEAIPAYGSGGFTNYSDRDLQAQLGRWAEAGFSAVKMKIGREPERDPRRIALAREAIGADVALLVDANGAFTPRQAIAMAERMAPSAVSWFEEPVIVTDLAGLREVRRAMRASIEIAGGEYGYQPATFRTLLEGRTLDVLQADATRCGGVTGWLQAAALCEAFAMPLSSHCAPAVHAALACATPRTRHVEYFHDHARIESMLFDGAPQPLAGRLTASDRPGLGLALRGREAEQFRIRTAY